MPGEKADLTGREGLQAMEFEVTKTNKRGKQQKRVFKFDAKERKLQNFDGKKLKKEIHYAGMSLTLARVRLCSTLGAQREIVCMCVSGVY